MMDVEDFAKAIFVYAQKYPASVTSWGRTPEHSKAVGGFDGDPHTWWLAVDLVYDQTPDLAEATAYAKTLGLWLIRESDHDHFQPLGWVNHTYTTPIAPVAWA